MKSEGKNVEYPRMEIVGDSRNLFTSKLDGAEYTYTLDAAGDATIVKCTTNLSSLDIPAVAAACAVSQSGLYSACRQNGYKTPNAERQKILIEKAKNLLISTDEPIENISSVLGFSSSSYFRKIFVKVTGKSPRQIRRESFI